MNEAVLTGRRAESSVTRHLRGGPAVAAQARAALEPLRRELGDELISDVELIASELATNSYRHSGAPDASIELSVEVYADRVRGEIADGGPGFSPAPAPAARRGVGGWGLYIVDSLADRWGVRAGPPTCVWFEIDRELSSPGSRPPEAPPAPRGDRRFRSPRGAGPRTRRP